MKKGTASKKKHPWVLEPEIRVPHAGRKNERDWPWLRLALGLADLSPEEAKEKLEKAIGYCVDTDGFMIAASYELKTKEEDGDETALKFAFPKKLRDSVYGKIVADNKTDIYALFQKYSEEEGGARKITWTVLKEHASEYPALVKTVKQKGKDVLIPIADMRVMTDFVNDSSHGFGSNAPSPNGGESPNGDASPTRKPCMMQSGTRSQSTLLRAHALPTKEGSVMEKKFGFSTALEKTAAHQFNKKGPSAANLKDWASNPKKTPSAAAAKSSAKSSAKNDDDEDDEEEEKPQKAPVAKAPSVATGGASGKKRSPPKVPLAKAPVASSKPQKRRIVETEPPPQPRVEEEEEEEEEEEKPPKAPVAKKARVEEKPKALVARGGKPATEGAFGKKPEPAVESESDSSESEQPADGGMFCFVNATLANAIMERKNSAPADKYAKALEKFNPNPVIDALENGNPAEAAERAAEHFKTPREVGDALLIFSLYMQKIVAPINVAPPNFMPRSREQYPTFPPSKFTTNFFDRVLKNHCVPGNMRHYEAAFARFATVTWSDMDSILAAFEKRNPDGNKNFLKLLLFEGTARLARQSESEEEEEEEEEEFDLDDF